jgi:quercetin dioxygenase-like cupin family protein
MPHGYMIQARMTRMGLYNWNAIAEEQLNPRLSRRVIHTQSMTIARLLLLKYATVPEHSHVHEQVTMVERGALKFILDGREQIVRGGEALTILPNSRHSVEALEDSVVTDVFSPAREDWIRGDDAYLRR